MFASAALVMAASMAVAAPGGNKPPADPNASPLTVFDANGKVVGRLAHVSSASPAAYANAPAVYVSINGVTTTFKLGFVETGGYTNWERVTPLAEGALYFTTSDCSGTAYMAYGTGTKLIGRPSMVLYTGGSSPKNLLYIAAAVAPVNVTVGSILTTVCTATAQYIGGVPVGTPFDLTSTFAEPYTVR